MTNLDSRLQFSDLAIYTSVTQVSLKGLLLTAVSPSLDAFEHLKLLDLSHNLLRALPRRWAHTMAKDAEVLMEGNPGAEKWKNNALQELVAQGTC